MDIGKIVGSYEVDVSREEFLYAIRRVVENGSMWIFYRGYLWRYLKVIGCSFINRVLLYNLYMFGIYGVDGGFVDWMYYNLMLVGGFREVEYEFIMIYVNSKRFNEEVGYECV